MTSILSPTKEVAPTQQCLHPWPNDLAHLTRDLTDLNRRQVEDMYKEAPIKNGMFDYVEFTRILKHGAKDKDEQ